MTSSIKEYKHEKQGTFNMNTSMSTSNYTPRFFVSPQMADKIIFNSDITLPAPYQYKRITIGDRSIASKMYEVYFNRRKASENNSNFYDLKYRDYYIICKNKEFTDGLLNFNKNAVAIGKAILKALNFIQKDPQDWNRPDRIILPNFNKIHDSMKPKKSNFLHTNKQSSGRLENKPLLQEKNTTKIKQSNNTSINTKQNHRKNKFKPMDKTSSWCDSARHLGLTVDTINHIAKFSDTYGKSAYKITGLIKEARDTIANDNNISKETRHFETNSNIVVRLGNKIYKLLTCIVNPKYKKASLSNFEGFIVNSLKRFFKWCFGLDVKKTVKPKTVSTGDHHRIIQHMPKWAKKGYHEKLHPTGKALLLKIQKQKKAMGEN